MPTDETARICRAYFDAWNARDNAAVGAVLAEDVVVESKAFRVEGREAFLSGGNRPAGATTELLAEAYDGDTGFQLYDVTNNGKTARVAEHLTVRDGAIARSEFVTDMADFGAFLAG